MSMSASYSSEQHMLAQRVFWCVAFILGVLAAMIAGDAHAQISGGSFNLGGFGCNANVASGQIFNGGANCGGGAADSILSGFICEFERLLSDIMGKMFCSVSAAMSEPVAAFATLAVVVLGIGFLMGLVPFTAKELAVFMVKMTIVMTFALNASSVIGFGYRAVMTAAYEGIAFVLGPMLQNSGIITDGDVSVTSVFSHLDEALHFLFTGSADSSGSDYNTCQEKMFGLLFTTMLAAPPIFMILLFVSVKLMMAFFQAVYGYMFAMLAIAFLITLAPIFIPMILFRTSSGLFDRYIQYFFAYVIQVVVVFAFIGMVIYMNLHGYIASFLDLIVPMPSGGASIAAAGAWFDLGGCGIQEFTVVTGGPGEFATLEAKQGGEVVAFFDMMQRADFMKDLAKELIKFAIFAYLIEGMLTFVPEMARFLTGQRYVAQVGGGGGAGETTTVAIPGMAQLNSMASGFQRGMEGAPTTPSGAKDGVENAIKNMLVGDGRNSQGVVGDTVNFITRMGARR